MSDQTRRDFLRSLGFLSLSGLGYAIVAAHDALRRVGSLAAPARPAGPDAKGAVDSTAAGKGQGPFEPAYLELHRSGELKRRGEALWKILEHCELCPRRCGVNRMEGKLGFCRASSQLEVSSYNLHFGEERPLVGKGGSGTIFLTNCGLRCVFCINWEISHEGRGTERSIDELASMMLRLQGMGAHNINVVTPTHYSPHIVLALDKAAAGGLRLPLVYNTCGWERVEILEMLDGIVDIYLPDFKYADGEMASIYSSGAADYPGATKKALLEMHRQVGVAKTPADGIMRRGLMIRHLVMPNNVGGSCEVIGWIAKNLPKDTYCNIMSQYRPMYRASEYPDIARRITGEEYAAAVRCAKDAGLTNLDIQGWRF
ncbi:MAG: radical SAM protein [bacterium]|nr:MAG: radical SAM protein [bacterium]